MDKDVAPIHSGLLLVIKRDDILQFATIWMNSEGTVLREISETDIHFMISKKYTDR